MVSKKILCAKCQKKCSGNVLRYQDRYYHRHCFISDDIDKEQSTQVKQAVNKNPNDNNPSLKAASPTTTTTTTATNNRTVERMVNDKSTADHKHIHAKGDTVCSKCSNKSYNSDGFASAKSHKGRINSGAAHMNGDAESKRPNCAGCHESIKDGQALIALDAQWHVWCFKCSKCAIVLHGEYVAKEGKPYCEKDYQKLFGVSCVHCKRYITGKVLQAGENHHFHPSCARCSKCGDPFVPGEEMYLQGEVIWHPRCGPGPESNIEDILVENVMHDVTQYRSHRANSPSLSSSRSRSRSASPYSYMSRQHGRSLSGFSESEPLGDLSRIYTCSYLSSEPNQSYLRRPIEPNPPKSPQFSRPMNLSRTIQNRSSRSSSRSGYRDRSLPRPGMQAMVESLRSSSPRPRSPTMQNEEPIELSQYPAGQRPQPDDVAKIERDDFPAPPFPYTDDRHKRGGSISRLSSDQTKPLESSYKSKSNGAVNGNGTQHDDEEDSSDDPQLKREEEELSKIATGIGKIFLKTVKEREKIRAWKKANLEPRASSRTPSASREPSHRLRYDNPRTSSPSRDLDRQKSWDLQEQEDYYYSGSQTRSSFGKSQLLSPSSSNYKIVSSAFPKSTSGYSIPNSQLGGGYGTYFERNRSNDTLIRAPASHLNYELNYHPTKARPVYAGSSNSSHIMRRSMPNVNFHLHNDAPPKLYPYHLLITSNYRLPPDVDRCHLERHLSNEEFQYIFHCDRLDFYRMPEWKRNELKRRAKLF